MVNNLKTIEKYVFRYSLSSPKTAHQSDVTEQNYLVLTLKRIALYNTVGT
jgi:hypothetical protein